mmetsp:Transcript_19461/g.41622  ORF Transcript_19461/g.41622 Transcript_19461/m.41622 type:complete len:613 (-) Transcript_19461:41-1879(-)
MGESSTPPDVDLNNGYRKQSVGEKRLMNEGNRQKSPSSKMKPYEPSENLASSKKHANNMKSEPIIISPKGPRILESSMKHQPYFHYQNITNSHPHFSLRSHPNNHETTICSNYGTTLTIIIFLHLLYFYQWNARRSRQDVCTSYDQLVEKKQFYRLALAIASHPPVDGGERDAIFGNINSHIGMTEEGGNAGIIGPIERSGFFGRCLNCNLFHRSSPIFQRIHPVYCHVRQRILNPLIYGSLSGLPLLIFASHILWQCRALEELYDDHDGKLILGLAENFNATQFTGIGTASTKIQTAGDTQSIDKHLSLSDDGYAYFRVLGTLAFTSIFLELSLLRSILTKLDAHVDFEGYRTTPRQLLSQRAMCSVTSLSTALLGVYDSHFPYAPPPVLPFVRAPFLSSSGFSLIFSILILALLTHRIHPVTSIMSGLLSGSLWSMGLTSFLGTRYWGNVMLFVLAFGMLISMKAQPSYSTYLEIAIPCIDYVAWDGRGEISNRIASSSPAVLRPNNAHGRLTRNNRSNNDLEMGSHFHRLNGGDASEERFPLLSSESSSMSGAGSSAFRGRVPRINRMESDLDGAEDLLVRNNEGSVPASSTRFSASLSRRAGGSGIHD